MTNTTLRFKTFEGQILYFNGMYRLPIAPYPTVYTVIQDERRKLLSKENAHVFKDMSGKDFLIKRLLDFAKTLRDELTEVDDIITRLKTGVHEEVKGSGNFVPYNEIDCLTDIADWLNDIIVYCSSENAKYGIPQDAVLRIIMSSNFSKQGADGKPIYDDAGKVMKGPGYWKPELQIKQLLIERIEDNLATVEQKGSLEDGILWK